MSQVINYSDYMLLNVGYADRLLLTQDNKVSHTEGRDTFYKLVSLRCKENHNAVRLDLIGRTVRGEYTCVNEDGEYCDCCDYYREYPTYSTWEAFDLSEDEVEDKVEIPLPFEPYRVVAVTNGSKTGERAFYYDDDKILQDFLSSFPEVHLGSSIIFKRIDDKPIPLVEYTQIAKRIAVLFCGCYSPTTPYSMDLIQNNGKNLLSLRYDTESG